MTIRTVDLIDFSELQLDERIFQNQNTSEVINTALVTGVGSGKYSQTEVRLLNKEVAFVINVIHHFH
jgi:hypothetical protein